MHSLASASRRGRPRQRWQQVLAPSVQSDMVAPSSWPEQHVASKRMRLHLMKTFPHTSLCNSLCPILPGLHTTLLLMDCAWKATTTSTSWSSCCHCSSATARNCTSTCASELWRRRVLRACDWGNWVSGFIAASNAPEKKPSSTVGQLVVGGTSTCAGLRSFLSCDGYQRSCEKQQHKIIVCFRLDKSMSVCA